MDWTDLKEFGPKVVISCHPPIEVPIAIIPAQMDDHPQWDMKSGLRSRR